MKYIDIEEACSKMILDTPQKVENYLNLMEAKLHIQTFMLVMKQAKEVNSTETAATHFAQQMCVFNRTLICDAKQKDGRTRYFEAIHPFIKPMIAYRFESNDKYIADLKKIANKFAEELIKWKEEAQ